MNADRDSQDAGGASDAPLDKLCRQLLQRWRHFPEDDLTRLRELLSGALASAAAAEAEVITVMSPVSHPARLQLARLVAEADLDSFYHQEWAELSVSHDGTCYLIYRRQDGGDYAVTWSSATSVPTGMLASMPPELAKAMLEHDDG